MELQLTKEIADLLGNTAYRHVLRELENDLRSLEDRMESCNNGHVDISLSSEWRALRKLLKRLKGIPEERAEQLRVHLEQNPDHLGHLATGLQTEIEVE